MNPAQHPQPVGHNYRQKHSKHTAHPVFQVLLILGVFCRITVTALQGQTYPKKMVLKSATVTRIRAQLKTLHFLQDSANFQFLSPLLLF